MIQIVSRGTYGSVDNGVQEFILCDDEDGRCYFLHHHEQEVCVYPVIQSDKKTKQECGRYRLYHVLDERAFTDGYHFELQHNCKAWQAYHTHQLPKVPNEHSPLTKTSEQVTKTTTCSCSFSQAA